MAREIYHTYPSGETLYAFIRQKSDDTVNIQGTNNFEVWVDGNIGTYDHPMTDRGGDYYTVDFESAIDVDTVTVYRIEIFLQAGGSPALDDIPVAQGEFYWDGDNEIDIGVIFNSNQTVVNEYDESTPPPVTVINESVGRV